MYDEDMEPEADLPPGTDVPACFDDDEDRKLGRVRGGEIAEFEVR